MSRSVSDRLRDILDAIDRCLAYQESMLSTDDALARMAQDAVLRNLGVIGEAVNHLPAEFTGRHPEIDWAAIVGMRNIVVHEYFRVEAAMLADVLDTDLRQLARILTCELDNE
ncbi:DUF86 domain-containing protein [Actinomyces ruminicola]|uniref:HepT-like ribonuclease domain-containing protein n=1 Tax=Actinomyces ruminicola TaxID=332524 RepID=UPI001C9C61BC|nr:HepT-like ribonuclease domain-containing protein [Actinomyces ruminicola]